MKSTIVTTPSILSVKRPLDSASRTSEPNHGTTSSSVKTPLFFLEDPNKPKITLPALNTRIRNLFPDQDVLSLPCVSARLFACFTIVAEQATPDESRPTRHRRQSSNLPLWSLLQALVQVELTSLGRVPQKKKVHFTGFDCSSTLPPVDSILGSQLHWEESIGALETAVEELHALLTSDENRPVEDIVASLDSLVMFLRDIEGDTGALMREECSRSMPGYWPPERFQKPAQMYRLDFENIKHILLAGANASISISVETQLAKFLGQAIRFYLRTIFNPVPLKVSNPPESNSTGLGIPVSRKRSRVNELLSMKLPDGVVVADSAVADGSISSVVSAALQCIYAYFGADALLASGNIETATLSQGFCTSTASQRGLPTRASPEPITAEELHGIVADIRHAHSFLHAAHACRFLSELMQWPGVKDEIAKVGGWKLVEGYAKKMQHHELLHCCSDDAHLVLLSNVGQLVGWIEHHRQVFESLVLPCEKSLQELCVRFKCGAKNKALRRRVPEIETIAETLEEVNRFIFPIVSGPTGYY